MYCLVCAVLSLYLILLAAEGREPSKVTDYCIIGAGPSGLELGYFFDRAGRDYVIFERNSVAGSFFLHYPRHRTLVSINKRFTGSANKEFNFRHDWNSLISDDESLQLKHYTKEYFPQADDYVRYLQDYAQKQNLNVVYDTAIKTVKRWVDGSKLFHLVDQMEVVHQCRTVIACTGLWLPNIPNMVGIEHTEGYENMSLNGEDYEGKTVLIIGRGNAGFETADHIVSNTAFIHMTSRSRIKMAYQTHYVGDVRAVNAQQVDTYQLKSLDGQFEGDMSSSSGISIVKNKKNGKLLLEFSSFDEESPDNSFSRDGYDVILRCLGFKYDFSIFDATAPVHPFSAGGVQKFPSMLPNYQAETTPDLFFAGVNTHSLDYKKSAGGFIHGFRYTTQALFRHLEWKYDNVPWPSVHFPYSSLLNHMLRRINEASGPYQMFSTLADIALLRDNGTVEYLEEVPVAALPKFEDLTGHKIERFILWEFEYGKNYSGPGKDVLHEDRVHGDPEEADLSNFLHPVLYYYSSPPSPDDTWTIGNLPEPDLYHHIVEDFLTDWTSRSRHVTPTRRFLESIVNQDLRKYPPEYCFQLLFKYGKDIPLHCKHEYLQGHGISLSDGIVEFGPLKAFTNLNE